MNFDVSEFIGASVPIVGKCLLVDDLEENLLALEGLLKSEAVQVCRARSGVEALELLLENDFALALIDVQMPEMDGFELAELMRGTERTRRIPIIFVTAGLRDQQRVFRGYEAGAVDFLFKPLDPAVVRSKVRVFLELHRQRRLLQAHEAQLRATFENAAVGLAQVTPDDRWLRVNPRFAEILDRSEADLRARKVSELIHPEDEPAYHRVRQQLLRDGAHFATLELRFARRGGEWAWINLNLSLIARSDGAAECFIASATDVTARHEAELALRTAVHARDEFLSIASHELKTPLTSIKLQLQLFMRTLERFGVVNLPSGQLEKMLSVSNRQVNHLTRLIDDLLDVSRIANGKMEVQPESTDLSEIIRDVLERTQEQIRSAKCELVTELPSGIRGEWDQSRIEQVLVNLVSNACKYASGARLEVSAATEGGHARITIRDHGPGIPEARLPFIFGRFERAVSGRSISGLGLGLYISREIVQAHGGELTVASAPGGGATFTVDLPLSPANDADAAGDGLQARPMLK
jgi:PAS domain S-box-containing protein